MTVRSDYKEGLLNESNEQLHEDIASRRNYPRRNGRVRELPDTVPWTAIRGQSFMTLGSSRARIG